MPTTELNIEKDEIEKRLKKAKTELAEELMCSPIDVARDLAEYRQKLDDIDWILNEAKRIKEENINRIVQLQKEITFLLGRGVFENTIIKNKDTYCVQGDSSDYVVKTVGNNGELKITKYLGVDKDEIIIPGYINGKKVIAIGDEVYINLENVKSIIISEGITKIGGGGFCGCSTLSKIKLPNSLIEMEGHIHGTFAYTAITDIILPNKLSNIPMLAFSGCNKLSSIIIGDNVLKIDALAFSNCTYLRSITLPGSIKKITGGIFCKCENLEEIILNEGITEIEDFMITDCHSVKKIVFPMSLVNISDKMFVTANNKTLFPKDLTIYSYEGSAGLQFAKKHNIKYSII